MAAFPATEACGCQHGVPLAYDLLPADHSRDIKIGIYNCSTGRYSSSGISSMTFPIWPRTTRY